MSNVPAIAERKGPAVWHGDDLVKDQRWVVPWTETEIDEIDRALCFARSRRIGWEHIRQDNFPLVVVAEKLQRVADFLENDLGLVKLSGFPVASYDLDALKLIWMGLGAYIGTPRLQDNNGQMMRSICDEGGNVGERHGQLKDEGNQFLSSKARTYSNGVLRFHTDRIDVVGLFTVQQARRGGESKVVSTQAVHNAMLAQRPDLVALLYQPIYRSRLGEEQGGDSAIYPLPVFALENDQFTSHYSRTYVEAAQLLPDTPAMSEAQWEALDLLADQCEKLCYSMTLQPGDIQLLNNHVIYHARDSFEDDAAGHQQRLLLRLWLSMNNSRALPENHRVLWGDVSAGALRGGIGQLPL